MWTALVPARWPAVRRAPPRGTTCTALQQGVHMHQARANDSHWQVLVGERGLAGPRRQACQRSGICMHASHDCMPNSVACRTMSDLPAGTTRLQAVPPHPTCLTQQAQPTCRSSKHAVLNQGGHRLAPGRRPPARHLCLHMLRQEGAALAQLGAPDVQRGQQEAEEKLTAARGRVRRVRWVLVVAGRVGETAAVHACN